MAKDLPYFKFSVSEWNDGDITLCGFEAQGLFINLCSLYWSQSGDLSLAKCKRRYSGCNANAWEELIEEGIIKIHPDGDKITIDFLDEQIKDRKKLSTTNQQNAKKRWNSGNGDARVIRVYSDGNAEGMRSHSDGKEVACNIEEKRREEIYITVRPKYINEKFTQVYDLKQYFQNEGRLPALEKAGWVHFHEFLEANPGAEFNDANHVYNSFRIFCTTYKPPTPKKSKFEDAEYYFREFTPEAFKEKYQDKLRHDPEFRKHFEQLRSSQPVGSKP